MMLRNKYCIVDGHRIKALRSFGNVMAGDLGGFVHSDYNLSHEGNCWIYDNAAVLDNAMVIDNATVRGVAMVGGYAVVEHCADVGEHAIIKQHANIGGRAVVSGPSVSVGGNARVKGQAVVGGSVHLQGTAVVYNRPAVYTRSDGYDFVAVMCVDKQVRVMAGCRCFTFEEAYAHWGKRVRWGTRLGHETLVILECLRSHWGIEHVW